MAAKGRTSRFVWKHGRDTQLGALLPEVCPLLPGLLVGRTSKRLGGTLPIKEMGDRWAKGLSA